MVNAWDFVLAALLLGAGWLGWKLKSLPLLGAGFAAALAPLAAAHWKVPLGAFLLDELGGNGLAPHQEQLAWWLILLLGGLALILAFVGLSKMLAQLQLEFLDRGFGALICCGILAALLSLNLGRLAGQLRGPARRVLMQSWSWAHLRAGQEPPWLEELSQKIDFLKLP
jgi:hypothetical protein